jgi:hypothetical protein
VTVSYLALLGFGYWLLHLAETEPKRNMKLLGRTVAALIMISSAFGLLCPVLFHCGPRAQACAPGAAKTGGMCPFAPRSAAPPAEPVTPPQADQKK